MATFTLRLSTLRGGDSLRLGAHSVLDDFNDNSIDAGKWTNTSAVQIVETGQQLVFTTTTASAYNYVEWYDTSVQLTGRHIGSRLVNAGNQALTSPYGGYPIGITFSPNNQVYWIIQSGTAYAYTNVAGVFTNRGSLAHVNGTTYTIGIESGNIVWKSSTDNTNWTTTATVANPFSGAQVGRPYIMVGTDAANASTTSMVIDDFGFYNTTNSGATVTGAAVLNGTGTLATSGFATTTGVFARSGAGTLVTSGTVTTQGIFARSGAGTLVTSAVVTTTGIAALNGVGSLSTSGAITQSGASVLNGTGTLVTSGTVTRLGATQLSGQLQLTTSGSATSLGAATLTGQLSNSTIATVTRFGVSVLNGTGSLITSGTPTRFGSTTLTGSGILAPVESSTTTVVNVSLNGTSSLVTSGTVTTSGASALIGAGNLSVVPQITVRAATVQIGAGSLVSSGSTTAIAAAILNGSGTLSTVAVITTTGSATLTGAGTLVASGIIGAVPPTVTMTGTGLLNALGQNTVRASTVQNGTGTLNTVGQNTVRAIAALTSPGTLTTVATVTVRGATVQTGVGTLTASGNALLGPVQAVLNGQGSLSVTGQAIRVASTQLNGAGSMVVSGRATTTGVTSLNGQGTLSVSGTRGVTASVTLNGQLNTSASGFIPAVVTGLAQMAANLSMEIIGRTTPPWVFPFIEFGGTSIKTGELPTDSMSGVDGPSDQIRNTTEIVASGINSIEGG